ncbi:MAG: SEC-C domain-containing protein [Nitrosomonas sp.]|uniref:SEC-C domain-containing protein n=1 Tax=Nitrosomonas sp. TaxID=42353 RepID=UPI001D8598EC|nr:SEC-C domain-containing protein [Nitrosomonas sp.]MBX9894371.1 SEC-C domain-containing protein [Nitrosomonas sp.]
MAGSQKLGRNDLCWCKSGRKYKHCHYGREQQEALPISALLSVSRQQFQKKECLHPQAAKGLCNGIIDAHTVQRARTLQNLLDSDNHVLTFYPAERDSEELLKVQRRGWRKASTFTGFCGIHDSQTFAPLENEAFQFSAESAFLLSYRALCHELYQKHGAARSLRQLAPLLDRGLPSADQREIQRCNGLQIAGNRKAIDELSQQKRLADEALLARSYTDWRFVCLEFEGPLSLATCGAPTPTIDLDGNQHQVLHDPKDPLQHLYLSIVSCPIGVAVVFGWRKSLAAPEKMVESLLRLPRNLLATYIVQYVFAHLENTCFSQTWWNALNFESQRHIRLLAGIGNPYYQETLPTYRMESLVDWKLYAVHQHGDA